MPVEEEGAAAVEGRDGRPYARTSLIFYAIIFYFLVAVNWILPDPMATFFDSFSPEHGREMTYNFLGTAALIVSIALAVGLLIRILLFAIEHLLTTRTNRE